MPICKKCGVEFQWAVDGDRWVLFVPVGEEGNLDRSYVDENGLLRADHRDICVGGGGTLNAHRLERRIKASEVGEAGPVVKIAEKVVERSRRGKRKSA